MSTDTVSSPIQAAASTSGELPRFGLDEVPHFFAGRVSLLTNFLPPYRVRMLEMLAASVRQLHVFVSVRMEGNRNWTPDWGLLDVTVQRNISFSRTFGNAGKYREKSVVHVPWDTLSQLVKYAPDVVISSELGMRTLQATVYCVLLRKPLMVWATLSEVTESNRGRMRHALRWLLLRFVDCVLVNGSSGRRYIEGLGFPSEQIQVVSQAVDHSVFAGLATRESNGVTRLLYTGQLIERKGLRQMHEALLRWCALHPRRRVHWTIVGSGPLHAMVDSWRGGENYKIEILGAIPYASVAAQYHAADIYVFPTLADEWGVAVNEAMIAGLPVFGSLYSQAVLDTVVDGVNGWTFHADRAKELDSALERAMMASAKELNAMRIAAIDTIKPLDQLNMCKRILLAIGRTVPALVQPEYGATPEKT